MDSKSLEEKRGFFNPKTVSDNNTEVNFKSKDIKGIITISKFNYMLNYQSPLFNMIRAEMQIGENEPIHICFKLSNNLSIYDLKKSRVFQELFKLGKFDNLISDEFNYIGAVTKENTTEYKLVREQEDKEYIDKFLNHKKTQSDNIKIVEDNENGENTINEQDETNDTEKRKIYKIKEDSDKFMKTHFQERENQSFNITDIKIEKTGKNDYKKYVTCKGLDMKTGEKFEIKELTDETIVGENGENSYIYTGYIEKEGSKEKFPVIFELPYTIKDAVNRQNILPMLELLSRDENMELKEDQLNFLGRIDEENKMKREECSSPESKIYLLEKIKEYALKTKHKKENKKDEEDKEIN